MQSGLQYQALAQAVTFKYSAAPHRDEGLRAMSMFGALDTAASGVGLGRVWMDVIADNVANVNTVRPAGEEPFRASTVVAQSQQRPVRRRASTASSRRAARPRSSSTPTTRWPTPRAT